jgi:hypothetical protein
MLFERFKGLPETKPAGHLEKEKAKLPIVAAASFNVLLPYLREPKSLTYWLQGIQNGLRVGTIKPLSGDLWKDSWAILFYDAIVNPPTRIRGDQVYTGNHDQLDGPELEKYLHHQRNIQDGYATHQYRNWLEIYPKEAVKRKPSDKEFYGKIYLNCRATGIITLTEILLRGTGYYFKIPYFRPENPKTSYWSTGALGRRDVVTVYTQLLEPALQLLETLGKTREEKPEIFDYGIPLFCAGLNHNGNLKDGIGITTRDNSQLASSLLGKIFEGIDLREGFPADFPLAERYFEAVRLMKADPNFPGFSENYKEAYPRLAEKLTPGKYQHKLYASREK